MNLPEFIEKLERIQARQREGEEDLVVTVNLSHGVCQPTVGVSSVARGFDWSNGKVVLSCEHPISVYPAGLYVKYRREYLYTISNLKKVEKAQTKVAVFRKEEKVCKNKWEAEAWLSEKLWEEEKSLDKYSEMC